MEETSETVAESSDVITENDISSAVDAAIADESKADTPSETNGEVASSDDAASVSPDTDEPKSDSVQEDGPSADTNDPVSSPKYDNERGIVERGIRAGMKMDDILNIPTAEMAVRVIEQYEKANGIEQPKEESEGDGAGSPADAYGDVIDRMEKDGEYDADLISAIKGMRDELARLKAAGESAAQQTTFDKQFGTLDKGVSAHVDAALKSQLRSKFDILTEGYAARNVSVNPEDVFREATKLALGHLVERVSEERKASALEQRKNLTLARPGGENGRTKPVSSDPDDAVAAEIWAMIGK